MSGRRRLPLQVVCGIIEHNGRFLAARRGPEQSNAGLWEFPGGKLEKGESAEEALAREICEELGIEVSIVMKLEPYAHDCPEKTIELIPFICTLQKGEVRPHEHAEVRWLDPLNAETLKWSPPDIPVMKSYLAWKNNAINLNGVPNIQ